MGWALSETSGSRAGFLHVLFFSFNACYSTLESTEKDFVTLSLYATSLPERKTTELLVLGLGHSRNSL